MKLQNSSYVHRVIYKMNTLWAAVVSQFLDVSMAGDVCFHPFPLLCLYLRLVFCVLIYNTARERSQHYLSLELSQSIDEFTKKIMTLWIIRHRFTASSPKVFGDYPIRRWRLLSSASDWIVYAHKRMWINLKTKWSHFWAPWCNYQKKQISSTCMLLLRGGCSLTLVL